ncbi:MAG: hypothetical protein WC197_05755 [Candidatus Gastranaerophilaceae bacterium]|jgi:hypothetical protein
MKDLISKDIILYFGVGLLILVYGLSLVIPKFAKVGESVQQINQSKIQMKEFEYQKQQKDQQASLIQQQSIKTPVSVFKSIYSDMTIENSSVELIDQIVKMMQETGNNITEISYTTDTIDPVAKAKLPENFHVLTLNLMIDSTYMSLENFFRKMYSWKYLYNINILKLKSSENNKRKLDCNMEIWLYIEK